MIEIDGKQVLTDLSELVDPSGAALVLVDMQRDFVEGDGAFARLGVDVSGYATMRPRLAALLAEARRHGLLIVHIQMSTLPGRRSDSPAQLRFNLRMHQTFRADRPALRYTEVGTPGHEFVSDLRPLDGELVVPKWRSSAFWGTNLDMLLRSNGCRTLIVTGCTTEGCVESTARDGLFNDYYVVIPEDCVASDDKAQHDASLLLMRHRFDVVTADDIVAAWRAGAPETAAVGADAGSSGVRPGELDGRVP